LCFLLYLFYRSLALRVDLFSGGRPVLLTTDYKHLANKQKRRILSSIGVSLMRPTEWLNLFLKDLRGDEDAVDYLERILFSVG